MTLLLISGWQWQFGAVTLFGAALIVWFMHMAIKGARSGGKQQAHPGSPGVKYDSLPFRLLKRPQFWMAVAVLALYIWAISAIFSDYSKKVSDKIPQQQTDTTRQAAEDMIKHQQ